MSIFFFPSNCDKLQLKNQSINQSIKFHSEGYTPAGGGTPDFLHAAMRPDMISETEVEISTEDCCEDEDEDMSVLMEEPEPGYEPVRKRKGW